MKPAKYATGRADRPQALMGYAAKNADVVVSPEGSDWVIRSRRANLSAAGTAPAVLIFVLPAPRSTTSQGAHDVLPSAATAAPRVAAS